jgi:hypothetical protein
MRVIPLSSLSMRYVDVWVMRVGWSEKGGSVEWENIHIYKRETRY